MQNFSHIFRDFFLDLVFPRECLGCGSAKSYLCIDCAYRIPLLKMQTCASCEVESTLGTPCLHPCAQNTYLDQLIVASDYHNNEILSQAVHLFKYRFSKDLAKSLSIPLLRTFYNSLNYQTFVSYVPLHKKRLKYRGFNQAGLLAQNLAYNLRLPYGELLKRIKNTKSQAELTRSGRLKNMQNAFEAVAFNGHFHFKQIQHVTIVDDVYTTGATLNECAKTLKLAGVRYVSALVLAKSFINRKL